MLVRSLFLFSVGGCVGWEAVSGCLFVACIACIVFSRNFPTILLLHWILASICSSISRKIEIASDAPRLCTVKVLHSSVVALDCRGRI